MNGPASGPLEHMEHRAPALKNHSRFSAFASRCSQDLYIWHIWRNISSTSPRAGNEQTARECPPALWVAADGERRAIVQLAQQHGLLR
jgi:hypothetical protein